MPSWLEDPGYIGTGSSGQEGNLQLAITNSYDPKRSQRILFLPS